MGSYKSQRVVCPQNYLSPCVLLINHSEQTGDDLWFSNQKNLDNLETKKANE